MNRNFFVPGRVNIIGEHTDYNAGLSLAFAVDRGVNVEVVERNDDETWIVLESGARFQCGSSAPNELSFQMAKAAWQRLPRPGVELRVTSDLPPGSGMSSSAAYLGALCLALGARGSVMDIAKLVQQCEADVGNHVGLLDQITTLGGEEASALLIDFSGIAFHPVAIPQDWEFTVVHSEVTRELAASGYQTRRRECEEIRTRLGSWSAVTNEMMTSLPETLARRAHHVVTENQRVTAFLSALTARDISAAGTLLNASHESLRDDFEVSIPEVDELVAQLQSTPGVTGARMMGGGFGGCIIVLHEPHTTVTVAGHRTWSVRPSSGGLRRLER